MLSKLCILATLLALTLTSSGQVEGVPFSNGFNLSEWFENFESITDIKFKKYTRQDFENMKSMGCDVVRLPVEIFAATGPAPGFEIDPLLFLFIDEVVTWAEDLKIYLIIDNHSFSDQMETSPAVIDTLLSVWSQVASRYKYHSQYILYEILNEPHGNLITEEQWYTMQQQTINAIRAVDILHTLIVGPYNWNNYNNLYQMPAYADTNLIYTFHFYDPFLFTSQTDVGLPFPYDSDRMPEMPEDWDEWRQQLYSDYPLHGTETYLKQLLDTVVKFREIRHVPVYCGEFGANLLNKVIADRAAWIEFVRSYLEESTIPWTMWSYRDYMGIFDPQTPQLFEYNMDTTIAAALSLNFPRQREYQITPDSTGFFLYDDYVPQYIMESNWINGGKTLYYSEDNPKAGDFCISWSDADLYGNLGFDFYPIRDLSTLQMEGYTIDFWVRCSVPELKVELRFEDTDTGALDHAWRNSVMLDSSIATFDGNWYHIQIPLGNFVETGAYEDNTLFEPEDKFDWSRISRFDFVAEYMDLHGIEISFDHIRIVNPDSITLIPSTNNDHQNNNYSLYSSFIENTLVVNFYTDVTDRVSIVLFNSAGRFVKQLTNRVFTPGLNTIYWDTENMPAGIYFIGMQGNDGWKLQKVLISGMK